MPAALAQALTELDGLERGFVLGALLAGAGDDPAFATSLPVPSRERCQQALAAIGALPRADRVRVTGVLAREARAVLPAGIQSVHSDHLRAALDEESLMLVRRLQSSWDDDVPEAIRDATATWIAEQPAELEAEGPATTALPLREPDLELLTDVQRSVFAGLAEVPPPWQDAAPRRWSRQLTLMAPAALLSLVTGADSRTASLEAPLLRARDIGARLAREEADGLGAAAQALAVAQRLPAPLGQALLEGARAVADAPPAAPQA